MNPNLESILDEMAHAAVAKAVNRELEAIAAIQVRELLQRPDVQEQLKMRVHDALLLTWQNSLIEADE
jgi:hypothetical protein